MSDTAPAVCLYTPFRLAVYESPETHETIVSYDSPASLFGSFGVPEAAGRRHFAFWDFEAQ